MFFRPNIASLQYSILVAIFGVICLVATPTPRPAQSLIKVPFPYSPINTSALPFMIAKDAKISEKHGLDGEFGVVDRTVAANTPPEAYYDNSYVDELKQSGFIKSCGSRLTSRFCPIVVR